MDDLDVLIVGHQKGPVPMALTEGGYAIEDGRITISISAVITDEALEQELFPEHGSICLEGAPIDGPLRDGQTFEHAGGMLENDYDALPRVHGYFGFHVQEIAVKWTVLQVSEEVCRFALEAVHDDVDYYDERAKPNPSKGVFDLRPTPLADLWIPV